MRIRIAMLLSVLVLIGQAVAAQPLKEHGERGVPLDRMRDNGSKPVPSIPVILDGVEYPAGKLPMIEEARYYVITSEDQEKGVMHAFTAPDRAGAFMGLRDKQREVDGVPVEAAYPYCVHPYIWSAFNKNRGGGGSDWLIMVKEPYPYTGERYPNLDFEGWNNTISYVEAACVPYWTTLYSCRNFERNSNWFTCQDADILFIESGTIVPDLVSRGFNNRTSSIRFCRFDTDTNSIPCVEGW